jgi:predicted transcriptional regulator
MAAVQDKSKDALKTNEKKWGKNLMDSGWTAFPSLILEKQHALGLDPLDINIILHLATYWWESENKPHPSKKTIAETIGVHPRTIQRRIASLEAANLIEREYRTDKNKGNKSNAYSFDGLIKELAPFAAEKIEVNAVRRAESEIRRKSKKPKFSSVTIPPLTSIDGGKSKSN